MNEEELELLAEECNSFLLLLNLHEKHPVLVAKLLENTAQSKNLLEGLVQKQKEARAAFVRNSSMFELMMERIKDYDNTFHGGDNLDRVKEFWLQVLSNCNDNYDNLKQHWKQHCSDCNICEAVYLLDESRFNYQMIDAVYKAIENMSIDEINEYQC